MSRSHFGSGAPNESNAIIANLFLPPPSPLPPPITMYNSSSENTADSRRATMLAAHRSSHSGVIYTLNANHYGSGNNLHPNESPCGASQTSSQTRNTSVQNNYNTTTGDGSGFPQHGESGTSPILVDRTAIWKKSINGVGATFATNSLALDVEMMKNGAHHVGGDNADGENEFLRLRRRMHGSKAGGVGVVDRSLDKTDDTAEKAAMSPADVIEAAATKSRITISTVSALQGAVSLAFLCAAIGLLVQELDERDDRIRLVVQAALMAQNATPTTASDFGDAKNLLLSDPALTKAMSATRDSNDKVYIAFILVVCCVAVTFLGVIAVAVTAFFKVGKAMADESQKALFALILPERVCAALSVAQVRKLRATARRVIKDLKRRRRMQLLNRFQPDTATNNDECDGLGGADAVDHGDGSPLNQSADLSTGSAFGNSRGGDNSRINSNLRRSGASNTRYLSTAADALHNLKGRNRSVISSSREAMLLVSNAHLFPSLYSEFLPVAWVAFMDVVGFTVMCRGTSSNNVIQILNELISVIDSLAEEHQIEKIKTIGDAYMCAKLSISERDLGSIEEEMADKDPVLYRKYQRRKRREAKEERVKQLRIAAFEAGYDLTEEDATAEIEREDYEAREQKRKQKDARKKNHESDDDCESDIDDGAVVVGPDDDDSLFDRDGQFRSALLLDPHRRPRPGLELYCKQKVVSDGITMIRFLIQAVKSARTIRRPHASDSAAMMMNIKRHEYDGSQHNSSVQTFLQNNNNSRNSHFTTQQTHAAAASNLQRSGDASHSQQQQVVATAGNQTELFSNSVTSYTNNNFTNNHTAATNNANSLESPSPTHANQLITTSNTFSRFANQNNNFPIPIFCGANGSNNSSGPSSPTRCDSDSKHRLDFPRQVNVMNAFINNQEHLTSPTATDDAITAILKSPPQTTLFPAQQQRTTTTTTHTANNNTMTQQQRHNVGKQNYRNANGTGVAPGNSSTTSLTHESLSNDAGGKGAANNGASMDVIFGSVGTTPKASHLFPTALAPNDRYLTTTANNHLCASGVRSGGGSSPYVFPPHLEMRAGLHVGPIASGIVGFERPLYDLFGDTVNTAARLESNGQSSAVHVLASTADLLLLTPPPSWLLRKKRTQGGDDDKNNKESTVISAHRKMAAMTSWGGGRTTSAVSLRAGDELLLDASTTCLSVSKGGIGANNGLAPAAAATRLEEPSLSVTSPTTSSPVGELTLAIPMPADTRRADDSNTNNHTALKEPRSNSVVILNDDGGHVATTYCSANPNTVSKTAAAVMLKRRQGNERANSNSSKRNNAVNAASSKSKKTVTRFASGALTAESEGRGSEQFDASDLHMYSHPEAHPRGDAGEEFDSDEDLTDDGAWDPRNHPDYLSFDPQGELTIALKGIGNVNTLLIRDYRNPRRASNVHTSYTSASASVQMPKGVGLMQMDKLCNQND